MHAPVSFAGGIHRLLECCAAECAGSRLDGGSDISDLLKAIQFQLRTLEFIGTCGCQKPIANVVLAGRRQTFDATYAAMMIGHH
jgi:hypothetical protein